MEFLWNDSDRIDIDFKDTQIAINSYHEVELAMPELFLDKRLTVGVEPRYWVFFFNVWVLEGAKWTIVYQSWWL
jgi:hypothetical protein